ncbi:MAG: choice-of-anchor tandem repeat GloVer-containing protein [Thermoanaerobaculia bacterium]
MALSEVALAQAFSVVHQFSGQTGRPSGGLIRAADGKLYGALAGGGYSGLGSVYVLTPDAGGGYTLSEIYAAVAADGAQGFQTPLFQAADGQFYGGTFDPNGGVIYRVDASGNFGVVHTFDITTEGAGPGALVQPGGGDFYGLTGGSGPNNVGTAFRMDVTGNVTVLHAFGGPEGNYPVSLVAASDGFLYGITSSGGPGGAGTIFRMDLAGTVTLFHAFAAADGAEPTSLVEGSDGALYGTTGSGGAFERGTVFRADSTGAVTLLHSFTDAERARPVSLMEASDGNFYGATIENRLLDAGSLFRVQPSGGFDVIHNLSNEEGVAVVAPLVEEAGGLIGTASWGGGPGQWGTIFTVGFSGGLEVVHVFYGATEGQEPEGGLTLASDGLLYGSTIYGGGTGSGTVYRLDLAAGVTHLHSFDGPVDGAYPQSSLIQASDGDLYGTASFGGPDGGGTVFRIGTNGLFTRLHSFGGADGEWPMGTLVEALDGDLYGTTYIGGAPGLGTAYRIDGQGAFEMLHEFSQAEGQPPSGLVQKPDGIFWGTTAGGSLHPGHIFHMDESGTVTPLVDLLLPGNSGSALLLASDGNLYGTSPGSVFRLDAAGNLSVIHQFQYGEDVDYPGELFEGADGQFYGAGLGNGKTHRGVLFRTDPAGNFTVVHRFVSWSDGADPKGRLVQTGDGTIYGTASRGGDSGGGVIFAVDHSAVVSVGSVSPGSGPAAGGTTLTITGTNFDVGASVIVGYFPATSVVVSGTTEITATVPALTAGVAHDVVVQNPDGSRAARSRAWVTDPEDVEPEDLYYDDIQILFRSGISVGCGNGLYCVDLPVTRAQMAVFLAKAMLGSGYVPPTPNGAVFADVPADAFAAAFIEDLFVRGITVGCGGGNYCPDAPVTRASMAPFLLKARFGAGYAPPTATGAVFDDVPADSFAADFIEDLAARGISAGCSAQPPLYCPKAPTTRGQMASFLVDTFGLSLAVVRGGQVR